MKDKFLGDRILVCLLLMLLMMHSIDCTAKTIRIKSNRSLQSQLKHKNSTYIFSKKIDLKGKEVSVPSGCVLKFNNGMLRNGTISGDETQIKAGRGLIFENVEIQGTWDNDTVYSEWLGFSQQEGFDNREIFGRLTTLCTGDRNTQVYMQKGIFLTSIQNEGFGFSIPSNTTFHSTATIKEIPNDFKVGVLISIFKSENVVIDGGKYIGDIDTHTGDEGEWSHGIKCEGSKNVVIKNVECNDFWGDGIDIIDAYDDERKPSIVCYNVSVDSVRCFYNRRQGISIEAVIGCRVTNSEFSYTGTKKYTRPADGIDIEAWNSYGEKLRDITIKNCVMRGNKGKSISIFANGPWLKNYELYINNILIEGCNMDDVFATCSYGIEYRNCKMNSVMHQYVTDLKYTDCIIKGEKLSQKITNRWE